MLAISCIVRRDELMGTRMDNRLAQTNLAIYREGMILSHAISGKPCEDEVAGSTVPHYEQRLVSH